MEKKSAYYVLKLPLCTQLWQEHILEKRYSVAEQVYNALLEKVYKRYRQMCQTRQYRRLNQQLRETKDIKARKEIYHSFHSLAKQYGLGKFELSRDATAYRNYFKETIDSPVSQNLAANVWKAIQMLLTGKAKQVSYKKPGDLLVLSGKTNGTSIRYRNGSILWKGLKLPVRFHKNSDYEKRAMEGEIRFCRLKRQIRHGHWHYYTELIFSGTPPEKAKTDAVKQGRVGIDIGLQQLAVVTPDEIAMIGLTDVYARYQIEIARLDRYMERSRRINRPQNYDKKGNIHQGPLTWNYSRRYQRAKGKRKELFQKMSDVRRQHYCILSKCILQMGNQVYVENLSFLQMMRRYIVSPSGKKNHRFYGKQMLRTAPGTFLRILENKLEAVGGNLYRLNPISLRAGGFNHIDGSYRKQPVREMWKSVDHHQIRRNFYTAFLMMNAEEDNHINLTRCKDTFDEFIEHCKIYQASLQDAEYILKAG